MNDDELRDPFLEEDPPEELGGESDIAEDLPDDEDDDDPMWDEE